MRRVVRPDFFARTADVVAPDLLGKFLVRDRAAYLITETEAYDGFEDKASHASRGRTKRTEVMFGRPGHWYVYLIYGMHEMLNIVTGPESYPSAVLIRAVEGIEGPGKLTRALGITRSLNGRLATRATGLWIEDRGVAIASADIVSAPRVGVGYAGEWAEKEWRFTIQK